jgi:ubiquinone/menaquinone biosynthesis C-methylase UbiE
MSDTTEVRSAGGNTDPAAAEERRTHIHQMWSSVAEAWGEHADYTDARHASETALMLEATKPRPGERVVDLACGAGGLGLAAAPLVDPAGEVVLSDVAPEMTEIADARAHSRGLTNTTARVLDLESIAMPDNAFDVVLCRDGLQFAVDPARAGREIARITRPGGRVALAVWGPRARNPWLATVLDAASAQLQRPLPPPGMPGPFALEDASEVDSIMRAAGFVDIAITEVSVPMHATSFDEWWRRTSGLAGPLSSVLASLPQHVAEALQARAREAAVPFTTTQGPSPASRSSLRRRSPNCAAPRHAATAATLRTFRSRHR